MNLAQMFPLAFVALMRNKARALLTTLGVVIGVASVISMVAVGEGAKARVEGVFAAMGTNMLVVLSGSTSSGGVMGGFGSMPTLTWEDLRAIRTQAPAVRLAAPAMNARVTIISDEANWTTNVTGSSPEFFDIRAWHLARGRLFDQDDVDANAKVIVLGQTASDKLFGPNVDPVGRVVRLRSAPFQVIGVLERKGQSPMGTDYDDTAAVPYTAFQTKIQGGLQNYVAGAILVSASRSSETKRAQTRGREHLARPSPHRLGRGGRLLRAQPHRARDRSASRNKSAHGLARGRRRRFIDRRRHRHHEHHARQRDRAYA